MGKLIFGGVTLMIFCCGCTIPVSLLTGTDEPDPASVSEVSPTVTEGPATGVPATQPLPSTEILPPTATQPPEQLPERALGFVSAVVDGDTIDVVMDGETKRVRYIGMDSPENAAPFALEATEANRQLVEGQIVQLEKDVSENDTFDRLLRYVYLEDGTFVNGELVRLGLAASKAYPPDTKYQDLLNQFQMEAQTEGLGIWGEATAAPDGPQEGSLSQVVIDPACSQFDSPGNDNETKDQEFVCVTNKGSEPVDLTAWSIRDEADWTYRFPTFLLLSGSRVRVRTGCGASTDVDLYWCKEGTAVWNNGGDCAYLQDAEGLLIDEYCY